MKTKQNQFVVLPKKDGEQLRKYEILIYVCIRRYMNKDTMSCYPSLPTISKDSGCGIPTIKKYIKEIERKGYIKSLLTPNGYIYTFSNEKSFEPFSYEFLDNENLSKSQKLQILCTQQFMFKNNITHEGSISYTTRELSKLTGISRDTLRKNDKDFIEQGLANQVTLETKDPETGLARTETFYHLDKFGQAVVFAIKEIGMQTQQNTENIQHNTKDIENLKKENELLKRQLQQLIESQKQKEQIFNF